MNRGTKRETLAAAWAIALLALGCGGNGKNAEPPITAESSGGPSTPQPIGHRFERAEDWVPRFDDPDRKEWQKPEHIVELLALEPGMTVADLGAGTGYFLPYLSRAVGEEGRVLALDIEPDMVRHMRERAEREGLTNVEARVVAVDAPKLAAGSVDRILTVNTWHHIPEREAYARKLVPGLKRGGAVYVVEYTKDSPRGPPEDERLPPDQIAAELAAGGLETEIAEEELPYQYLVIGRLP